MKSKESKGAAKPGSKTMRTGGGTAASMPPGMVRPQGKAISTFKVARKISK